MRLAIARARRWLSLSHARPTLADVWATNLLTEAPCQGTISDMTRTNMLVDDFVRKELINL